MSGIAFAGFTLGAFFTGIIVVLYNCRIPKVLGIYGIIGPMATFITFGIIGGPFWEWMLLFSILLWIIPLSIVIQHDEELHLMRRDKR